MFSNPSGCFSLTFPDFGFFQILVDSFRFWLTVFPLFPAFGLPFSETALCSLRHPRSLRTLLVHDLRVQALAQQLVGLSRLSQPSFSALFMSGHTLAKSPFGPIVSQCTVVCNRFFTTIRGNFRSPKLKGRLNRLKGRLKGLKGWLNRQKSG